MTTPPQYANSLTATKRTVSRWLLDFLAVPYDSLGRDGALCPFVKPALRAEAIRYRSVHTGSEPTFESLTAATLEAVEDFEALDWAGIPQQLQSLVVVFPDLDPESAMLLDQVHANLKDEVVRRQLMFAQFHPQCAEVSVRNTGLKVGAAPLSLLAFRRLAVHDILFLGQRSTWFTIFRDAFGHRFREPAHLEPALVEAFRRAEARFGGER